MFDHPFIRLGIGFVLVVLAVVLLDLQPPVSGGKSIAYVKQTL